MGGGDGWAALKEKAEAAEEWVFELPAFLGVPIMVGMILAFLVAIFIPLLLIFGGGDRGGYVCGYNDGPKGAKTPVYCDYPVVEDL